MEACPQRRHLLRYRKPILCICGLSSSLFRCRRKIDETDQVELISGEAALISRGIVDLLGFVSPEP